MVTSVTMEDLFREHGNGKYYKPDMYLRRQSYAVEIKPTYPSRHERQICAEYARVISPIVLLFGGSNGSTVAHNLFRSPDVAQRNRDVAFPGNVPLGLLFEHDSGRPSGVRIEHVGLGMSHDGKWGFFPVADLDANRTQDKDNELLHVAFNTAGEQFI